MNNLGMVALYQSQDERAWRLYEEALAIMREIGDAFGVNVVRNNLGIVAIRRGELDQAAALATACLDGCRALGDAQGVGSALVQSRRGGATPGRPRRGLRRSMRKPGSVLHELGDDRAMAEVCSGLATLALLQGDDARAAALVGTSLALAQTVDDQLKIAEALEGVAAVAAHRAQQIARPCAWRRGRSPGADRGAGGGAPPRRLCAASPRRAPHWSRPRSPPPGTSVRDGRWTRSWPRQGP